MSVGILIVAHPGIGESLLQTAIAILGTEPQNIRAISIINDRDPEATRTDLSQLADKLDNGSGILFLSDIFGGTPSNIAMSLTSTGQRLCVAGVNLPMLLKAINYQTLNLTALADKIIEGGRRSITTGMEQ